jgi:predicted dithiol-disulfide oxidoreductase (DUF899 family)
MYGPQRQRPCPMCTSLMSAWDGEALDIGQRVSFVMIARSPIERLVAFKRERGWRHLRSTPTPMAPTPAAMSPRGRRRAGYNVFTRRDGTIRHFWSGEMVEGDPGEDPRGAPDMMPLWTVLDTTPEGRGTDWYPRLNYPE